MILLTLDMIIAFSRPTIILGGGEKLYNLSMEKEFAKLSVQESFYITTAIHYTNGKPHMGHAYENITADVIARYHRIVGRQVYFLTGTDEHGQKIATTAEGLDKKPIELCDEYAAIFEQLTKDLNMSNDRFIRTTSEEHKKVAQWAFQKALDNGDIYLGQYEGWYNVREETFVSENDAKLMDYKDEVTGKALSKMKEESYFFRMSKYQDRLKKHILENPEFIQPEDRRLVILQRLDEPLLDLSVSRNTFSHGVPLPNDDSHVMYVWFDALSNYLSGIQYPDGGKASQFWPANVHIIGKDIVWFHAVIWPCLLMSIDLKLPKTIYGHGFVSAADGRKMSKSIGNVIDPYEIMNKYSLDTFRYFICRETPYGKDMPFSESDLINIHNSELADTLGNLVHRAVNLCGKYSEHVVPQQKADDVFDVPSAIANMEKTMQAFELQQACNISMNLIRAANKYLTDKEPWHMKENEPRLVVVRTTLEAIYVAAHFLHPFIPSACESIFDKLHTAPKTLVELNYQFNNLTPGTTVDIGNVLFNKIVTEDEKASILAKQQAKDAVAAAKKAKAAKADIPLFASMDIRVGKITKVWEHPDSTKLFCEEIDIGNDEPLQIASGLRAYYSLQDMQDKQCLVLVNLKPAKLGGFKSHGMVLCASSDNQVEFISPPHDAKLGERVFVASESSDPLSAAQMKKQKILEKVLPFLTTDENCIAKFKSEPFQTTAGPCASTSLINATIS